MNTHAATLTFSGSLDEVLRAARAIGGVHTVNVSPGVIDFGLNERSATYSPQSPSESSKVSPLESHSPSPSPSTTSSKPDGTHGDSEPGKSETPTDAQLESLLSKRPELRPHSPAGFALEFVPHDQPVPAWVWADNVRGGWSVESTFNARNAITVRMLEALPESAEVVMGVAFSRNPLGRLFAYWSAQ